MKIFLILFFSFLILTHNQEVNSQNQNPQKNLENLQQNIQNQQQIPENQKKIDENQQKNPENEQNNPEKKQKVVENQLKSDENQQKNPENEQNNPENKQKVVENQLKNDENQQKNPQYQQKVVENQQQNSQIQKNKDNNHNNIEIPKKDINNRGKNPNDEKKDKPFNLTESLINFYQETFGNDTNKDKNKVYKESNNNEKIELEDMKKREAEMQQKLIRDRDQRRREMFEARAKAELIRIEAQQKEMKRRKEQEEKAKFDSILANTTFEDVIQITLEKGETETLFLDLESFNKIKMAVVVTDEEAKVNFVLSGPNARGRTSVLYKVSNKNYLYYEYESLRKGEYMIEITNTASDLIELVFLLKQHDNKKKDIIDTEKIDKISMLLNTIDNNINQLRNKKKIEILKVNTHNEKIDQNNKYIVVYSVIEIITMIIVFFCQSYYISSIVSKL